MNKSLSGVEALGTLQKQWVLFVGDIVGPENVQLVTVLLIALLGISFIGLIFKTIKSVATAFILAVGITVIAGSLGVMQYVQLTPEVVEQVLIDGQTAIEKVQSGFGANPE